MEPIALPSPESSSSFAGKEEEEEEVGGGGGGGGATYDEFSMNQTLLFNDCLKDLKNLRKQLYSAAEYFEISYATNDQKDIVVETLKDYTAKALVNTIDHLGSVSCKVDDFLHENIDEVSTTELRVSSIQQRIQMCQDYTDREGRVQQTMKIRYPLYRKHYILPTQAKEAEPFVAKRTNPIPVAMSIMGRFLFKERETEFPGPASCLLFQSRSLSQRISYPSSCDVIKQRPSHIQRSMSFQSTAHGDKKKEHGRQVKKSKSLVKSLLSIVKSKRESP